MHYYKLIIVTEVTEDEYTFKDPRSNRMKKLVKKRDSSVVSLFY